MSRLTKRSALDGLRILDFTRILAGPYCTMLLGDLGAEVLKVERPDSGDDTRSWIPPVTNGQSCYFLSLNRNKKSVCLDLKTNKGRQLAKDLAARSDVVIENFLPGTMKRLGLDYKTLSKDRNDLIYCSISGYGPDGPYVKRGGFDVIAAAIGGLIHITGPQDGDPCKVGVAMTDISTGLYAKGAICAALFHRERTGQGQNIECNLLSTQVACLVNIGSNYLNAGKEARRLGTAHESIVPYQAFRTSDSYIVVGAGNDSQFAALSRVLNLNELATDPAYRNNSLRVENRETLLAILSDVFLKKPTAYWLRLFADMAFPFGAINSMKGVFDDPQVQHLEMVKSIKDSNCGDIRVVGPAVKYSQTPAEISLPPPLLGQHTREVLSNVLGLSNKEIEQLKTDSVHPRG